MSRTYVESQLDFQALQAGIASIDPPTITASDVLERLRPQIMAAHKRGVTAVQLRDYFKNKKIHVSAADITRFITGQESRQKKARQPTAAGKAHETPPAGQLDLPPPRG